MKKKLIKPIYKKMPLPKTDNQWGEYQQMMGDNYKLLLIEPPNENGEYPHGDVGTFYYSEYASRYLNE